MLDVHDRRILGEDRRPQLLCGQAMKTLFSEQESCLWRSLALSLAHCLLALQKATLPSNPALQYLFLGRYISSLVLVDFARSYALTPSSLPRLNACCPFRTAFMCTVSALRMSCQRGTSAFSDDLRSVSTDWTASLYAVGEGLLLAFLTSRRSPDAIRMRSHKVTAQLHSSWSLSRLSKCQCTHSHLLLAHTQRRGLK